jgi:glyoxylase-like metal-dependent hydrolase (beta-lactamase superfamily II)
MDLLCIFRVISRGFSAVLIAAAAPILAQPTAAEIELATGKRLLAQEHPDVIRAMARHDGFGGPRSSLIANRMQDRAPELVAEARSKMTVEPHGKGLWLIRFPYVNVVLVETKDSLVLLDTGYAAIGPVLRDLIPTLSPKPLKTIVITHTHVDHAYGAFALLKDKPQIITSDLFPRMVDTDIRLRGSIAKYNNQPLANQPKTRADFVMPTVTFRDRMERMIGGEKFVFIHAPAETEEQIYIWMPRRKALITADYYQGFLPNAGNGKRIQRHVEEWTAALRHMVSLKPALLLPMHGKAIAGEAPIAEALGTTADAMEHISTQVVDRLNKGERKDVILSSLDWPEKFVNSPLLATSYVRPEDIGKMVAHRWTGWWDDIPSHHNALNFEEEAREAVALAGGVDGIDKRVRDLLPINPRLATRLTDWAYFGAPDSPIAMRLAVDVYLARIAAPDTPIQEATIYLDIAARARARLELLKSSAH